MREHCVIHTIQCNAMHIFVNVGSKNVEKNKSGDGDRGGGCNIE